MGDNNKSGLETVREIIANRTLTATKANKTTPSSQTAIKMTGADADVSTLDQTPAPQVDREHTTPEMAPNQTDGSVKHDYEVKGKEPVPEPEPSLLTWAANAVKGATCGAITYKAPPTTNLEADMSGVMDGEMDTSSSQADLFDITGDISMTTKLSQHEHINTHAISPSQGTHNTSSEQTNSKPKNHSTATTHNEQPGPNFDMDDDNEDIFSPRGTTQQPHEEHPGPSVNMVEVDKNSFIIWNLTQRVHELTPQVQISEAAEHMGEATEQLKECFKDMLEKESNERRKDQEEAENRRRVEAQEQHKRYEEKLTKERAEHEEQRKKDKTEFEERLRNEKAEHEEQRRKDKAENEEKRRKDKAESEEQRAKSDERRAKNEEQYRKDQAEMIGKIESMEQTMIQLISQNTSEVKSLTKTGSNKYSDDKSGTICHKCSETKQRSEANTGKNNDNNDSNEERSTQGPTAKLTMLCDNTRTTSADHPGKSTQKLTVRFARLRHTSKATTESHPNRNTLVTSNRVDAPTSPGTGGGKEKTELEILIPRDCNQNSPSRRDAPTASDARKKGEKEKTKS